MRRLLMNLRATLVLFLCILTSPVWAALALDGTPVRNVATSSTSVVLSTVTISNNDIVVVLTSSSNQITGVSGSVNGAYTKLGDATGSGSWSAIWYVVSASAGTENITASQANGAFIEAVGFGVSGANTSTPWDTLGGPSFVTNTVFHSSFTLTTVSSPDMVIAVESEPGCGGPFSADSGYTILSAAATCTVAEYQQTASTGTFTINSGNRIFAANGVGAALVQAGGAAIVVHSLSTLGVGK